jgi:hypothetical protein
MILRSCNNNFTSAHDFTFRWPSEIGAIVEPTSWNPEAICGYGLHGFQYGEGDYSLADMTDNAQWIVFSGDVIVPIGNDKVKTNRATILHIGQGLTGRDRMLDCHAFMRRHRMLGNRSFYSTNTGGNGSTNTGGNYSTNTGGNYSTNTGGNDSTNTGGNGSTNTGGDYSTNTGGNGSYFTTGKDSTFTGSWFDGKRIRRKTFYSGEDYESDVKYYFESGTIRKA